MDWVVQLLLLIALDITLALQNNSAEWRRAVSEAQQNTDCSIAPSDTTPAQQYHQDDEAWLTTFWNQYWPCDIITACVTTDNEWGYGVACLQPLKPDVPYIKPGIGDSMLNPITWPTPSPTNLVLDYLIDSRIWAVFNYDNGGYTWYNGRIQEKNENNEYTVLYDDGDREENVNPAYIRLSEATNDRELFALKERVQAQDSSGKWALGTIRVRTTNSDGEYIYAIEFDSGEMIKDVPQDVIRPYVQYWRTMRAEALICEWRPATIDKVIPDGRYLIKWAHNSNLKNVEYEKIRKVYERFKSIDDVDIFICHDGDYSHEPADPDSVCSWYPGWVVTIAPDDTYLVQYWRDDGNAQADHGVPFNRLRVAELDRPT